MLVDGRGMYKSAEVFFQTVCGLQYQQAWGIHQQQGKYEEALEMLSKSIEIRTCIYGGDSHLDVAKTRENMANIYVDQGHYDKAYP